MLFNSLKFLLFLPIVLLVYFVLPKKIKQYWLLFASYFFYASWDYRFVILLFSSTLITYIGGIIIDNIGKNDLPDEKGKKYKNYVVIICIILNFGILFYFKYTNFAIELLNCIFDRIGMQQLNTFDIVLPVGISFFTFQAFGYIVDVYRNEINAERNFFKYALFVSFFPQLVAGPIERSKNLLKQLETPKNFLFENVREGLLLMLYGYFMKIVIADRVAIFVNNVYGNISKYPGFYLIIATIFFAIQIYCDFSGYSIIAKGCAKFFGIDLMENFNAPYISETVTDFWRNWHISLTSWFKDYLYIPLGGNRKGFLRKQVNKLIVFLASGLWHGANITFIVWGGINGIYQVIEELLLPIKRKISKLCRINSNCIDIRIIKTILTFVLVDFSWIFFRATSINNALQIIKSMFADSNIWILFDKSIYKCGLDESNFNLVLICILVLLISDIFKKNGVVIRKEIIKLHFVTRLAIISFSIVFILVFGIWGSMYDASSFIYFQF